MHRFTLQRLDVLKVTEQLEAWGQSRSPEILRAMRDRRMSANFNIFMLSELAARRGDITRQQARDIQAGCYARIRRLRSNSIFNSQSRIKEPHRGPHISAGSRYTQKNRSPGVNQNVSVFC